MITLPTGTGRLLEQTYNFLISLGAITNTTANTLAKAYCLRDSLVISKDNRSLRGASKKSSSDDSSDSFWTDQTGKLNSKTLINTLKYKLRIYRIFITVFIKCFYLNKCHSCCSGRSIACSLYHRQ